MKREVAPQETTRAEAFSLWMTSPMPMVTLTKTFNLTKLLRASKRRGIKCNALICWCIGKAASNIKEFYVLPEKDKLFEYDSLAINVIVNNRKGGINSCDIALTEDFEQFNRDYTALTRSVAENCKSEFLDDAMIIGTSAMVATELDSIVNQYTDKFLNPMVMWGATARAGSKPRCPYRSNSTTCRWTAGRRLVSLSSCSTK